MIYLQLFNCVRSLIMAGDDKIQRISSSLKETNERIFRALYPHAKLMGA